MMPGNIKKIAVKNFVTYVDVEFYPRSNLNVIIGPNGTGKSTIVAAIILGLGGTAKTIGRGTKICEYVKYDCSEATINIELQGNVSMTVHNITRIIYMNNQSKWFLNNNRSSEQEVKTLVKQLNIEVNNLCQFLPQDRVQDFSKMDKKELLANTQKVLGRQDLIDKQAELIKLNNESKIIETDIETLNNDFKSNTAEITRLEGKVQNLNEKNKYLNEIKCAKRKMAWLNYNSLLKKQKHVEKDKELMAKTVKKLMERIEPAQNKIKKSNSRCLVLNNDLMQTRNNITKNERKIQALLEKIEDINNERKEINIELNAQLQALMESQNEIDAVKAKIDKLVNDENAFVQQYGNENDIDAETQKLYVSSTAYRAKSEAANRERILVMNDIKKEEENLKQLQEQVEDAKNIKYKRLQKLQKCDNDAYNAVLWLRKNKNIFQGKVYEPMMLELDMIDSAHAKYMESIIPLRDRVAFTCENREDMNLLHQRLRDEENLSINVVHSGSEHPPVTFFSPPFSIDAVKKYGFFAYAIDLLTGPQAIIKYLCRLYHIHRIPIGDRSTYNKQEEVPELFHLFFSDIHRFAVNMSRYTGVKSIRVSEVEGDNTLSICIDNVKIDLANREINALVEKIDQIKDIRNKLDAKIQVYENQRQEVLTQRQNLLQQKNLFQNMHDHLVAEKSKLNQHMHKHKTEQSIKDHVNNKFKRVVLKIINVHEEICDVFRKYDEEIQFERKTIIEYNVEKEQSNYMKNNILNLQNEYEDAQNLYKNINSKYNQIYIEVKQALETAKKLSDGYSPSDPGFKKFAAKYSALPSCDNELQEIITTYQTKLECLLTADDGEIEAYENAQKIIATTTKQLQIRERQKKENESKTQTLHNEWFEPLNSLVNEINRNFSDYFESMGCAAEVHLSQESGIKEYTDYGLCIKVTYRRGEPLQELNQYLQSGGERTVATAIYLLSMQDLTVAPFRCVDEINQGMDPQNESRIFEILIKATTKNQACQYFLITPKLVSALEFKRNMTIHTVHNGQFLTIPSKIDIDIINNKRKTLNEF